MKRACLRLNTNTDEQNYVSSIRPLKNNFVWMKKLLYFIIISLLLACTQNTTIGKFTINATIKGLTDSKVYLKKYTKLGFVSVDSTTSKNGVIQFNGEIGLPELYRVYVASQDYDIPVFIESSSINILADLKNIELAEIKGSASDSLLKTLYNQLDSIDNVNKLLYEAYKSALQKNDKNAQKELEVKLNAVSKLQQSYMKNFVGKNSTSSVAAFVLYKYLSGETEFRELDSLKNIFDASIQKSVYIELLNEQLDILRKTQVGEAATDFSMADTLGKTVKLSSFYGKYLIIDFWASWCPNCREENPELVGLYNEFNKKGLAILGVSFDTKRENWLKAIQHDSLTWNHVSDFKGWENAAGQLYGIRAIPSNILLDTKGIIIGKNLSIN